MRENCLHRPYKTINWRVKSTRKVVFPRGQQMPLASVVRGPLDVQGLDSCARSFSSPPPPLACSLSRPARARKPLLKQLKPQLKPLLMQLTPLRPLRTLLLLQPTPLRMPLRALQRCNLRLLAKIGARGTSVLRAFSFARGIFRAPDPIDELTAQRIDDGEALRHYPPRKAHGRAIPKDKQEDAICVRSFS